MSDSTGRERLEPINPLSNTFIGLGSGGKNTTGNYNTFLGHQAGTCNITGFQNTFIGAFSGWMNTTGQDNSFFGSNAGQSNVDGNYNSFFGESAGILNVGGDFNAFFGYGSGEQNTSGESNCFFGGFSGQQNTTGQYNSFFGAQSGQVIETGQSNSFFGESSAVFKTSGDDNAYFGKSAGISDRNGSKNTLIGSRADFSSGKDSLVGSIALGYNAQVSCDRCAVIGGTGADTVNVGIGTTAPTARLEVNAGDIKVVGGGIFVDGTALNVPDYVFDPGYEMFDLNQVERFIAENKHLHGIPSMHDKVGWSNLSLENRDMKLLEKVEELFLHVIALTKQLEQLRKDIHIARSKE